jgi:LPPG:FO 2-phospho-L-lactate transferase
VKVVVLTGGVGGAKFVLGLQHSHGISALTAIVNTGDDFRHLGLSISPDIDTLLYTLSGKANVAQGWGREGESWNFMAALKSLGGPEWFNLGDGDLGLHVWRSERLAQGKALSAITSDIARAWGITATILPMSNDRVATEIETDIGKLAFQNYFVEHQCRPVVRGISFEGAAAALPAPGVLQAIAGADAIFIAPSNPFLSVDPILSVAAIKEALAKASAPKICISPLVGGTAVKGPTAKLMAELGIAISNQAIAAHYGDWLSGMLHDESDAAPKELAARATHTMMKNLEDKIRVAEAALGFARELRV